MPAKNEFPVLIAEALGRIKAQSIDDEKLPEGSENQVDVSVRITGSIKVGRASEREQEKLKIDPWQALALALWTAEQDPKAWAEWFMEQEAKWTPEQLQTMELIAAQVRGVGTERVKVQVAPRHTASLDVELLTAGG
jgi:hypothetical protein